MTSPGDQVSALVADMLNAITRFESDDLAIGRLSWELKSRLAALGGIADRQWVERLRTMRNQIDLIHAVFSESGRATLSDAERQEVRDILDELKAALQRH